MGPSPSENESDSAVNEKFSSANESVIAAESDSDKGFEEYFTLPHRFQVDSTGLHLDLWSPHGVHVDFHWQRAQPNIFQSPPGVYLDSRWTPDGPHGPAWSPLDSTYLTQGHINFNGLHVDSMWTPII